jgi:hypothetical protein
MKILKTGALCVLTCLCYASASAQQASLNHEVDYNKPKIFADQPHKLPLNVQTLETLLNYELGEKIKFSFASNFHFQGAVVSRSDADSTKTVVIKSTNHLGATLTITRNTNADGTYAYIGRMLSFKHGDAFEISQENGQFMLVKKSLHDLFDE